MRTRGTKQSKRTTHFWGELAVTFRLSVVREQLINDEESRKHLLALKDYHFIKHHQVLQNAFYLVGFSKEEINLPGTNELNWRKVREELFNEEFLEKVLAYEYKGPKEETVQVYSLINRIKNRLENIGKILFIFCWEY